MPVVWLKKIPPPLLVTASAWGCRIISALSQLFCVGLLLSYLGVEQYAVLAVVLSLDGWFALSQLGFGPALQNYISEAKSRNESFELLLALANKICFVLLIALVLLMSLASSFLQKYIFSDLEIQGAVIPLSFMPIVCIIYVCHHISGIAYRVYYAYGKGYIAQILQATASVITVIGVLFSVHNLPNLPKSNKLFLCTFLYLVPASLISMFSYIAIFFRKRSVLDSTYKPLLSSVTKRSIQFFFFNLMAGGVLLVDYLIMSHTLSYEDIALYAIITKLFGFIFFLYNALLQSFWPYCAEELTLGKWKEVNVQIRKYMTWGGFMMGIATLIMAFFGSHLLSYMAPSSHLRLPLSTTVLYGAYLLLRVWCDTYAMLLQSYSYINVFLIVVPIQAAISITSQYYFSKTFGLNGIIYGLIISFVGTVAWILPWRFNYFLKRNIIVAS